MSNNRDLDKAFKLIEEGNELEKSGNHWKAADSFGHAMILLEKLANEPATTQDEQKIAKLYRSKSRQYRQTARDSLIQALVKEKNQDSQSETTIIASTVSMQEAEARITTFSLLFSKTVEDVGEKTNMLEERLMELNASLPSGFKTSKERMADINRGLGRLGLSLYPNSEHNSSSDLQPPQSTEDQVASIIAQAKDEARYDKPATDVDTGKSEMVDSTSDDVETSESEDSDDSSVSMGDIVDEPVLKNRKVIRHKVVKAQVKLAELIALLNTEPDINLSGDDMEEKEKGENDEEKDKVGFDLGYGKATLTEARDYLNKALKEWPEDS